MERIDSLITRLRSMGYRNRQIRSIIESCVGGKKLPELTEAESKKLENCLATQIDFAIKCFKATRGT